MPDGNDTSTTVVKWNFAALICSTLLAGGFGIAGTYMTLNYGKQSDENQVCASDYKPSDIKAVEAEKFLEYNNTKLYAKWNEQSAIIDYIANGMGREEAETKARGEFARLNERPQALKKYIENEPEILLSELQNINKALSSDCMQPLKGVLRKIYDEERMSR